jgi:SAM-dependent methyltransferase
LNSAEFDNFALEYEELHRKNIRASGETPAFFAEYKVLDMRRDWDRRRGGEQPEQILDFGGGVGASAPFLRRHFPQAALTLADISRRSLEIAEARGIDGLDCLHFAGVSLPLDDRSQDLVLAACVFHHIPAEQHVMVLGEIRRVLRPGGRLFVFEHNPWNPITVRAVNTCPFDEKAVLITAPTLRGRLRAAGFSHTSIRFRIFFPHALRALRPAESALSIVPFGAQYCAVAGE